MGSVVNFDRSRKYFAKKAQEGLQREIESMCADLDDNLRSLTQARAMYSLMLEIVQQVVDVLPDSCRFDFRLGFNVFRELVEYGEAFSPVVVGISDGYGSYEIFVFTEEDEYGDQILYPQVVWTESEDAVYVIGEDGEKLSFSEEMVDIIRAKGMQSFMSSDPQAKLYGIWMFHVAVGKCSLKSWPHFLKVHENLLHVAEIMHTMMALSITWDFRPVLVPCCWDASGLGIAQGETGCVLGICYDTSAYTDEPDEEDGAESGHIVFHQTASFSDDRETISYLANTLGLDVPDGGYIFPISKEKNLIVSAFELDEPDLVVSKYGVNFDGEDIVTFWSLMKEIGANV